MSQTQMKIGNVVWEGEEVRCAHCSERLCEASQNWKDHSLARRGLASERLTPEHFGPSFRVQDNANVELAELFCPNCKALLSVELYLIGEPYRWDYRSADVAGAQGYDPAQEWRDDPSSWISF
jgi:acetone carboxylase gamma subunit